MPKPIVAIVGRPNVGKSTLFNRLAGGRLAVVDEVAGTTRDRLHAESHWRGLDIVIVDTGGIDPSTLAGSGGQALSIGSAEFVNEIRAQAGAAIRDADAILFLVDTQSGVTPADREVAEILRKEQRKVDGKLVPPVILVANKSDSKERRQGALAFYELGMGEPYAISALHGTGTGDMLDAVVEALGEQDETEDGEGEDDQDLSVAIVGKPNAGKSTLLNALVGQERAIVSDIPGTTRDAVDTMLDFEGLRIRLIDTAGLRKRGKIEPGVERYSAIRTMKAIERADVALLLIDATTGVTAQDAHIAGFVQDAWKSAIVLVNKWDAIDKDTWTIEEYRRNLSNKLGFIHYAPLLFISAKTGQRVKEVLPTAIQVGEERLVKLTTSHINKFIQDALFRHPPPSKAGRPLKIYYGTQVRVDPPTFMFYVNEPKLMHFSYKRFLENRLRELHGFLGTPVRFVFKKRE